MSNKNKQLKKLKLHHDYLNRKVAEVTELRMHDRSIESKTILMRLKKEKLALKDEIARLEKSLKASKDMEYENEKKKFQTLWIDNNTNKTE